METATETPAAAAANIEKGRDKAGLQAAQEKLSEAKRRGDLTAEKALIALSDTHRSKLAAREAKKRLEKECKDREDAAEAAFCNTIEAGLPAKSKDKDKAEKLDRVVVSWQGWGEAKTENIELVKEAKLEVERCEKKFDDAMEDAYQLRMTFK